MFHRERRNRFLSTVVLTTFPFVCFLAGYLVTTLTAGVVTLLAIAFSRWFATQLFNSVDRPNVLPEFWFGLILWGSTVLAVLGDALAVFWLSRADESRRANVQALHRARRSTAARRTVPTLRSVVEDALIYMLAGTVMVVSLGLSALIGWYVGELVVAAVLTVGLVIGGYFSTLSLVGGYLLGVVGLAFALVAWFRASSITLAVADTRAAATGDGPLLDLVASVAIGAGIPAPVARVLDEPAPEIFSVCSTKRSGAILASTGLLDLLARDELEGVVAHETVRIKNGDARLTATLMALFGTASILSRRLLKWCSQQPDNQTLLLLPVAWFGLMARLVGDVFGLTVKAAFGRAREQLADAEAIELTRDPSALIAALKKMQSEPSRQPKAGLVGSLLAPQSLLSARLRALDAIGSVGET